MAQEARFNATAKFTAFSEGGATGQYVYEWIVFSNGDTWEVQTPSYNVLSISPVIYLKVAVSFMALYNTTYSQSLVGYLIPRVPSSTNGYSCGVDESGTVIYDIEDKTNSMIISAARYAIENNVTLPASLAYSSPSQPSSSPPANSPSNTGPTITANPYSTPISTIAPQPSSTPTLAPSPSSSQTSSSAPSPTSTPSTSPTTTANQTNPTASPSASNTPLSSSKTGAPWQTNPVIVLAIVVVVAIAVILPVIILRRNGSTKPH